MAGEYLTRAQIEAKYPDQWVLVDQIKKDKYNETIGGVVVAAGTDKEAVLRASEQLPKPVRLSFWYTGPIPEDVIFLF